MTKEELIAKMAATAGITKVAATTALEAFTGAVTTSLKKGTSCDACQFRHVYRRKAKSSNGSESSYRRSPEDTCRSYSEIFCRQRTEGCGEVDSPTVWQEPCSLVMAVCPT